MNFMEHFVRINKSCIAIDVRFKFGDVKYKWKVQMLACCNLEYSANQAIWSPT